MAELWFERPLMMPIAEIIKDYREAKNPKKQIDILADLNHTKPSRIAWILHRCGEEVDKYKMPREGRFKDDAMNPIPVWEASEIAHECDRIRTERYGAETNEETTEITEITCEEKKEDMSYSYFTEGRDISEQNSKAEAKSEPKTDSVFIELSRSEIENLKDFFECAFITFAREAYEIINMDYVAEMGGIYTKLKAAERTLSDEQ
jgi:hypothetical protein